MTNTDKIAAIKEFIADATDALTDPTLQNPILAANINDSIAEAKRQIIDLERIDAAIADINLLADYLQATEHFDNIG
jgi:hypothetical protein